MKRPNVKDYDLKIYGYARDLSRYIDYLEFKLLSKTKPYNFEKIDVGKPN